MNARSLLLSLGIRTTLKGFHYLQYALELCIQDEEYLLLIYKWLCLDVAKHFNTTQNNVEHCMRTAIGYCWSRGNRDFLIQLSSHTMDKAPSNSEFINLLYNQLRIPEKNRSV